MAPSPWSPSLECHIHPCLGHPPDGDSLHAAFPTLAVKKFPRKSNKAATRGCLLRSCHSFPTAEETLPCTFPPEDSLQGLSLSTHAQEPPQAQTTPLKPSPKSPPVPSSAPQIPKSSPQSPAIPFTSLPTASPEPPPKSFPSSPTSKNKPASLLKSFPHRHPPPASSLG